MLDRLSNGDITKHKEIMNLNYKYILTTLSLWSHRDRLYENQQAMQEASRNNRR